VFPSGRGARPPVCDPSPALIRPHRDAHHLAGLEQPRPAVHRLLEQLMALQPIFEGYFSLLSSPQIASAVLKHHQRRRFHQRRLLPAQLPFQGCVPLLLRVLLPLREGLQLHSLNDLSLPPPQGGVMKTFLPQEGPALFLRGLLVVQHRRPSCGTQARLAARNTRDRSIGGVGDDRDESHLGATPRTG
jgi:hypothetical protein